MPSQSPTPRDVRDILDEAVTYVGRMRQWTQTLAANPARLNVPAVPPRIPVADRFALDDVNALRDRLVTSVPAKLAAAADEIDEDGAPLRVERLAIERATRDLVRACQETYGVRLMRHACHALHLSNAPDQSRAEDVVSELWLTFIVNLPNFAATSSIYTYLRTILDNLLRKHGVDFAKQAKNRVVGEDAEAGEIELAASTPEPLLERESQEEKERLARALLALADVSQRQFRRLCLYHLLGLEAQRLAKVEGTTQGGMSKGLSDARRALAVHLEQVDAGADVTP